MSIRLPQGRAGCAPSGGSGTGRRVGPTTGRVVTTATGVAQVALQGALVTVSVGAAMLRAMAADAEAAPRPGDRVQLLRWSDGHLTIERVIARAV